MYKYNWIQEETKENVFDRDLKFWEKLSNNAYPVTHGEIRIPISIEPFIIKKKDYQEFFKNIKLFISAAKKLADKYFVDEEIRQVVVINDQEKELIKESAKEDFIGIIRPDLFWSAVPKLVELNADFPDGFFMHDVTAEAMLENLDNKKYILTDHAKLFSELLEEQGLNKDGHIFIGYNKDRSFIDEFYLSKIKLEKFGWNNISVGTFDDLIYKDGFFYYNDRKIDLIRRGAENFKLSLIPGLMEKLINAQKSGQVKIINNFKNRLLGHKSLLAALWDERFHKYLESTEINAIKDLLPKTVKLNPENLIWAKENKDLFVLKPVDLAEGKGVSVGCDLEQKAWNEKLDLAMKNFTYWILQEKIVIPEEEFTLVDQVSKKIIVANKKFDFDPYLIMFKDRIELGQILVRFSDSSILNVMQGGGLTYAFIENT